MGVDAATTAEGDKPGTPHAPDLAKARENEERFAAANGHIRETAASLEMNLAPVPFLCECSDLRCTKIIQLSLAAYESARAHAGAFLLLSGHDDARVERIIARNDGYVLVEKFS